MSKGANRVLRPGVAADLRQELAVAERMAAVGKDLVTGKLNENVYGSTEPFNAIDELKVLHENNIIDEQWMEANVTELEKNKNETETKVVEEVRESQETVQPEMPVPAQPVLSEDPNVRLKQVAEELAKMNPKAPKEGQLRAWKETHGNIYILPIEERIFIYRYLKRQEWVQLQTSDSFSKMRPDQQDDLIFNKCVLWPKLEPIQIAGLPANTVTLISEQVRLQSLFLNPIEVASITIKI